MKIWITRHGQTDLNKAHLMQGLSDISLNETGRRQARATRELIGEVTFDAVYASPLDRAIETASLVGNVDRDQIKVDPRLIETDFGNYERQPYSRLGLHMNLFWLFPEVFPAPKSVESVASMVARSSSFLKELETKAYDNVLIVCHGGIIRALKGYLEDKRSGLCWRPRPKNCEVRVYESVAGSHRFVKAYHVET